MIISEWMCAHLVWNIHSFHIFTHSFNSVYDHKSSKRSPKLSSLNKTRKCHKAVLMSDYKKYWLKLVLVTTDMLGNGLKFFLSGQNSYKSWKWISVKQHGFRSTSRGWQRWQFFLGIVWGVESHHTRENKLISKNKNWHAVNVQFLVKSDCWQKLSNTATWNMEFCYKRYI